MHPAPLKDTHDLLRPDERTRGIMDRDIASITAEIFQTSPHGILSPLAARDKRPHFFKTFIAAQLSDFIMSVFTSNDNDLGDRIGLLERVDRVRNDRPTRDYREQFVKAHAPTPSRRDDNSREHLLNVKKVKRVTTLKRRKGKPVAI